MLCDIGDQNLLSLVVLGDQCAAECIAHDLDSTQIHDAVDGLPAASKEDAGDIRALFR